MMVDNVKNAGYELQLKAQVEALARLHLMPMFKNIESDSAFIQRVTQLLTDDIAEISS